MTARQAQFGSGNASIDRVIAILLLFDDDHLVVTAGEISERLGIGRSTAYRYVQRLKDAGMLEEAEGKGYRLGLLNLRLGRLARSGTRLIDIARPYMEGLSRDLGETAILTRRDGTLVTCIDRVEAGTNIRLSYDVGQVAPLHAGAHAKALWAWESPEEVERLLSSAHLPRLAPNTMVDHDLLREHLRKIRTVGYAVTYGETEPHLVGVAAPVFSPSGSVEAAVGVAGLEFRLTPDRVEHVAKAVVASAESISGELQLRAPPA